MVLVTWYIDNPGRSPIPFTATGLSGTLTTAPSKRPPAQPGLAQNWKALRCKIGKICEIGQVSRYLFSSI